MAKKKIATRKDDALSIVEDSELVEQIDSAMVTDSDVMIEMSETEPVEDAVVEDAKYKKTDEEEEDAEDSDPSMPMDDKEKKKHMEKKSLTLEDVASVVRSVLAEQSAVAPVSEPEVVAPVLEEKSVLDISVDKLYNSINSALQTDATYEQRLESLNPVLAELGEAIKSVVKEKSNYTAPAIVSNDQGQILEALAELSASVKVISNEVATMKAQSLVESKPVVNRVPVPRSINPLTTLANQEVKQVNPNSLTNIVRRTVSSQLPLK